MVEITELDLCRDFPAPDFPVEKIPVEEWRNGLIVRMPNWLGDAVMALPALWQLKKLKLGVLESLNLFELAGYKLSENYEVDRAYLYLIQNNVNGDIEEGNEYLESIGVEKQHYLGVKSRE